MDLTLVWNWVILKIKYERDDKWKNYIDLHTLPKCIDDGEFTPTQLVEQCTKQELGYGNCWVLIVC